ncbi:hypothetical protein LQZ18_15740 [Lachnospiraceae bacterium ZAX-1]
MSLLKQRLRGDYIVASISFEGSKEEHFELASRFCHMFMRAIRKSLRISPVDIAYAESILDLKIWHGKVKHEQAYQQFDAYLDSKHTDVGYLITFDFCKDKNRQPKAEWVEFEGKKYSISSYSLSGQRFRSFVHFE